MKAGLWLPVILLAIAAAIIIYGATFLSYEQAMHLVYGKAWFAGLFVVVAVGLVGFLVINRSRGLGLFLAHFGILVIIVGGFLTWGFAVSGTLRIKEGETKSSFDLDDMVFSASIGLENKSISVTNLLGEESRRTDLDAQLGLAHDNVLVSLERYVPDPRDVLPTVRQLGEGYSEPAIEISVFNVDRSSHLTMFANSPQRSHGAAGGLKFDFIFVRDKDRYDRFVSNLTTANATSAVTLPTPTREDLIITTASGKRTVNLKPGQSKVGFQQTFADRMGTLKILRYVPDFVIDRNMRVRSRSDQPNNPAIQVELTYGNQTSSLWLFGKMHGFHAPSLPAGVSIEYKFESAEELSPTERNIIVLAAPGKALLFLRGKTVLARAEVGDTFAIPGAGGAHVTVENFWGSASRRYQVVEGNPSGEVTTQCVRASVRDGSGKLLHREWVPLDKKVVLATPKGELALSFMKPKRRLGFDISLERFESRRYPGSMMPSAFISTVIVNRPSVGHKFTSTISPNHPLVYGGYKLYQYAYDKADDGRMVSILGVSRDPGVPAFYIGSLCLVVGMLLHFLRRGGRKGVRR